MLSPRTLAITAITATLGLVGCAQTPTDHGAHRSDAASAAGMAMPMGAGAAPMARMDEQMKAMQAMHDKMMQAKTPEQRSALMAEHMKLMQDSMAMMRGMGPGGMMGKGGMGAMNGMKDMPATGSDKDGRPGMPAMAGKGPMGEHMGGQMGGQMGMHHQMMDKRMQMMQSMMQMMMDRMAPAPGTP